MSQQTPYDAYQAQGYSSRHTAVVVFSGTIGLGLVLILGLIVIKILGALDQETLRTAGTMLLFGMIGLFLLAGALWLVAIFIKIKEPGVQLSGTAGDIEKKLGLG